MTSFHEREHRGIYRRRHDSGEKRLYRSRSGMIMGVCKGLAEYLDFSVGWMRFIAVCLLLVSTVFPAVVVYLIAAILMKPEPVSRCSVQHRLSGHRFLP